MKNSLFLSGLLIIVILGGVIFWFTASREHVPEPVSDYKNATYEIDGTSVTLTDGFSQVESVPGSASKTITRYFGNRAIGDLNGDGMEDVVFILTQEGGGSGTFYYVAVALKTDEGYTGTNAVLLGDRIAPQTTEIRDSEIIVNYAERAKDEPMTTQPSVGVSKYLKIENGKLVEGVVRFGFIGKVEVADQQVTVFFDDAKWLSGTEGEDAAIASGVCTEKTRDECLPNDYFILNTSSSTDPLPLDPSALLFMKTWNAGDQGILDREINISDFAELINDAEAHWSKLPYNITVRDGRVVRVEEVYVP